MDATKISGANIVRNSAAVDITKKKYSSWSITTCGGKKYEFKTPVGGSSYGGNPPVKDEPMNYLPETDSSLIEENGVEVDVEYSHTNFSSTSEIDGTERKTDTVGVTFLYGKDFGNWGYTVSVPVKNYNNNGTFDAFDNISLGLAFLPEYHVLLQQVHGISFDVGAVAAYEHHWFDDKSKFTDINGRYVLSDFDNPSSFQAGPVARLGWQKDSTFLSALFSHIDVRNFTGESVYGKNSSITISGIGVRQILWTGGIVGMDFTYNRLHNVEKADLDYNEGAIVLQQELNSRDILSFKGSQTFDNSDYRSTSALLTFTRQF